MIRKITTKDSIPENIAFTICFVYWFGHLLNMAIPFLILIQIRKCRLCLVTDCEATARTCFGKGCAAAVVLWADLDRLEYFNNKLSSSSVGRSLRLFDYFHFFKTNSFIFSKWRKMPVYWSSFTGKDWIQNEGGMVSVLHQKEGGIGKSIPKAQEISRADRVNFPITPEYWWSTTILFIIRECME